MSLIPPAPVLPHLEQQVLTLVAEGHEDRGVAALLGIQPRQVAYRLGRVAVAFGLPEMLRAQLVHLAYDNGALPLPRPVHPLLLGRDEYLLLRVLTAGGTVRKYASRQKVPEYRAAYVLRRARRVLGATSNASLVHRAWTRQVMGPSGFADDLARFHALDPAPPGTGEPVVVPLVSGYRLAAPAWGHRLRHLTVPTAEEAAAAARFLSGRRGYDAISITTPAHPADSVLVTWGQARRPRHTHTPAQPSPPDVRSLR
ncbi:hypothetical protein [Streptomyces sp. NPDC091278]|uniref:hypothetical protein n=1 Tax=Streptomyces sp. NPDC091278 TaxID=3155301 RepID=UPI00344F8A97